jgi:hypothetical protein
MKNITFSIDETILDKARVKARANNDSLNSLVQNWLRTYVNTQYSNEIDKFYNNTKAYTDRTYTREEMNER